MNGHQIHQTSIHLTVMCASISQTVQSRRPFRS